MTKNLADELQRTARQALAGLQPDPQGEEPGGLPLRRLIAAAFRGRYLLFGTTMFGLLIGAFLGITTPNTYVSEGKFIFQSGGAERENVNIGSSSQTSQESIATGASYVLESDDLLRKVVDKLGAARILAPYNPGAGSDSGFKGIFFSFQREWNAGKESDRTYEAALKQLKRAITMDRPRGSDVMIVRCAANDPKLAQEILHTWMDEAIPWHIEKYEDKKAYDAAEANYANSVSAREAASKALDEFLQRRAKVSRFEDEKERLEKEEVDARTERDKLAEELQASRNELERLVKALDVEKSIPLTVPVSVKPDTTLEARKKIEAEIANLTMQRLEWQTSSEQRAAEQVANLSKKIEVQKAELDRLLKEKAEAKEVLSSEPNPELAIRQLRRGQLKSDIDMLDEKLASATRYVGQVRGELAKLVAIEAEFLKLRDAKVAAEDAVKNTSLLWDLAQRKRALGAGAFSTLKDMQTASLPLEKEGPNRGKLVLGAVLVGLFFGFGVLLLRALPDDTVRTRDDLERIEGLAVVGMMPKLDGVNLRRHGALREQGW